MYAFNIYDVCRRLRVYRGNWFIVSTFEFRAGFWRDMAFVGSDRSKSDVEIMVSCYSQCTASFVAVSSL